MSNYPIHVAFPGRLIFVGFGSIGQGVLPLILRHVGMTRGQIGAMLAAEGMLVSALGLLVGLALGFLISLILIHVVNRQSFHWTMDVAVPWVPLAIFSAAMLAAASLTALFSARQAMTDDAARAVKDDW